MPHEQIIPCGWKPCRELFQSQQEMNKHVVEKHFCEDFKKEIKFENSETKRCSLSSSTSMSQANNCFYGYVPVECSCATLEESKKKLIIVACIRTVVKSQHTDVFREIFKGKKVSSFVRLDSLNANMVFTARTLTFFYIEGKTTKLIARYSTDQMSYASFVTIDNQCYFGVIVKCEEKRECLVLKLTSPSALTHVDHVLKIIDKTKQGTTALKARLLTHDDHVLKIIDKTKQGTTDLEARLKPAQCFHLSKEMSPFYHGAIEEDECERLLIRPGDFLFRASRNLDFKGILVVQKLMNKNSVPYVKTTKHPPFNDSEMFKLLQNYQYRGENFKRPVMKLNSL